MQVGGSGVDLFGLYALAVIFNQIGLLWACGVAMRFRSVQAGPLMQTPVFMALFLAPVYVPLDLLQGWIHAVARLNPLTFLLEAGRGFIQGEPTQVAAAFALAAGALRRLRRLGAHRAARGRARGLDPSESGEDGTCARADARRIGSLAAVASRRRPRCCPRRVSMRSRAERADDDPAVVGAPPSQS